MKKLAILTVNYNNYRVTEDLLQSLVKQKDKNFKVYIADLSDKKKKISRNTRVLRNFSEVGFTDVVVGENKGYASGVNLALKQAVKQGFERFIVINNDTEVASDFTNAVSASLDKNPESVLGGKIYYFSGYEYHAKRYKKSDLGKVLWYAGGIMDWDNAYTRHRGVDEVDSGQYDAFEQTEFVTGALICFDKTVLDTVGLLDESYFLYYEDADWCERAKRAGIRLYYDPSIVIWHKNAQSTGGAGSDLHQKYQKKNRLKFGLKYAPLRTKLHLLKNYIRRIIF